MWWFLPKTVRDAASVSSPVSPVSIWESDELFQALARSCTLSAKSSPPKSWSRAWRTGRYPRLRSSLTSLNLTATNGEVASIMSALVGPVLQYPMRESGPGHPTNDGCGRTSREFLGRHRRDGSWAKTSRGFSVPTLDGSSPRFSPTWTPSGTMLHGEVFGRPTSGRPTAASGSSSSDGVEAWPTPSAGLFNDGEDPDQWERRRSALRERHGNDGAGIPLAVRSAQFTNEASPIWPTPRTKQGHTYRQHAADGRQGLTLEGRAERWRTPSGSENEGGTHATVHERSRLRLKDQTALWSTPRAEERQQQNGYAGPDTHVALSKQAKDWPTPQASEEQHAGPSRDRRRGDTLTKHAEGWPTPRAIYADHPGMVDRPHLSGRAIELWRTPDASPQKTDFSADGEHRGRPTTSSQATQWATPISRDYKDGGSDPNMATPTDAMLGRQVLRTGLPAPASGTSGAGSSPSGPNSPPRPLNRPRLSPVFVEWLVGVPVGWTDFEPLGTSSSPSRPNSRSGSSTPG